MGRHEGTDGGELDGIELNTFPPPPSALTRPSAPKALFDLDAIPRSSTSRLRHSPFQTEKPTTAADPSPTTPAPIHRRPAGRPPFASTRENDRRPVTAVRDGAAERRRRTGEMGGMAARVGSWLSAPSGGQEDEPSERAQHVPQGRRRRPSRPVQSHPDLSKVTVQVMHREPDRLLTLVPRS